jgi:trehalose 6-phosphate synthase/phosphatase
MDLTKEEAREVFATGAKQYKPVSPQKLIGAEGLFASTLDSSTASTSVQASSGIRSFLSRQYSELGRQSQQDHSVKPTDSIIIVSYFLPVILNKSSQGEWTAIWDIENIIALQIDANLTWVGSVRYNGAPIPTEDEENVTIALLELNCHPIFINSVDHRKFYNKYCKQHLWPLLHQIADVYGPINHADIGAKGQADLWYTYSTVNRKFRDKVVEVYQAGDIVWIHGFHLMLLPSFLRRILTKTRIGYFFHTPFPSSEIWRTLFRREDLLRGILSADHIGFHLYEYARHFLTTCHRVVGYGSEMSASGSLVVNVDGREVSLSCIHCGIDLARVNVAFGNCSFEKEMNAWKQRFHGKIIVAGIDRLERLKGIPLKLVAIEDFMDENPCYLGKIVFSILGISAHERGDDYRQTQHDVKMMVARLNSKYGEELIYFEEKSERDVRLAQRLSFFAASDILMITATRDGLNRMPMEFTIAKNYSSQFHDPNADEEKDKKFTAGNGTIILSEFISSSRVMRGALSVNPWKVDEVKQALISAIEMNSIERADRMRRNLEFSNRLTTENWTKQVIQDIKSVKINNEDEHEQYTVGLGMGFRVMAVKSGFHSLDLNIISKKYRNSSSRLLVFDWGGTLVAENDKVDKLQAYAVATGQGKRSGPSNTLKHSLEVLCNDPNNIVFVVSGKDLYAVSSFFGNIKGLGLGAEHGFYYRWPKTDSIIDENSNNNISTCMMGDDGQTLRSRWQTIHAIGDQTWKFAAKMIMDIYVQRTHGTYIEQKGNALIWQFRDADPEFGYMQSKELEENLTSAMSGYLVEVLRGGGVSDGYIEARPAGVSKGLFIQHILALLKSMDREVDFILGIGDDSSDEPMYEQINRVGEASNGITQEVSTFSVTVGKKPSLANSYVDDPNAVMELLSTLNKATTRLQDQKKYFSTIDLQSHQKLGAFKGKLHSSSSDGNLSSMNKEVNKN